MDADELEPKASDDARDRQRLAERAARAAAVAVMPVDADDVRAVARFPIGPLTVAIDLRLLRAAIPLRWVTPVPLAPPSVIGILRFQGMTLTALSLASLLGIGGMRRDPAVLVVVELPDGRLVAFDAEEIPRVETLRESAIRSAVHHRDAGLSEVTTDEMQIVRLLDLSAIVRRFDAILSSARRSAIASVGEGADGG